MGSHETLRLQTLQPVEFGLTEEEKACIAVRNTFLDIGEPRREEFHRRRSAPVVFSLADKTSLSAFLQQSCEKAELDLDSMSVCTTDTWDPLMLSGSEDASDMMPWSSRQSIASDLSENTAEDVLKQRPVCQPTMPDLPTENVACMVVRNTFLTIDQPKDNGSQRRNSAPIVVSLEDKAASEFFLQSSGEKVDKDLDTASFYSTETSGSLALQAFEEPSSELLVVRNTFLDVQVPKV